MCFAPQFQGLGRNALGEGNFTFHLGVGSFQFLVEVLGNVHGVAAFHRDVDARRHIAQLHFILDLVIADVAVHDFAEHIQHGHAVVGMRSAAGSHHAGKVPGSDGIDGRTADPHFGIGILGIQTAGPHETVFAAGRIRSNGAGFHVRRPAEGSFHSIRRCYLQHLNGRLTGANFPKINLLLNFFLCHDTPLIPFVGLLTLRTQG